MRPPGAHSHPACCMALTATKPIRCHAPHRGGEERGEPKGVAEEEGRAARAGRASIQPCGSTDRRRATSAAAAAAAALPKRSPALD
eukprot:COSAG06_NODE_15383_length_1075_cov_0.830943_2_plen_85_part_01